MKTFGWEKDWRIFTSFRNQNSDTDVTASLQVLWLMFLNVNLVEVQDPEAFAHGVLVSEVLGEALHVAHLPEGIWLMRVTIYKNFSKSFDQLLNDLRICLNFLCHSLQTIFFLYFQAQHPRQAPDLDRVGDRETCPLPRGDYGEPIGGLYFMS